MIPNILSIAGSDPSGGAGIQADLKAISANGGYGMAALTALTAQNTQGVTGVQIVASDFVAQQIETVFADVRVDAVKIGMVATAENAKAVAAALDPRDVQTVLDPVMIAKGGDRLLSPDAIDALRAHLLPLATVLTPNLPEAAALLDTSVADGPSTMEAQAERLTALGPEAVLLKGGHLGGDTSPDLLFHRDGTRHWLSGPRVETKNTHGTGCTLSAALAAQLAQTDLRSAAHRAKAYVAAAIAAADALTVGTGHGPLDHFHQLRTPA